jgi:hypothetical protein
MPEDDLEGSSIMAVTPTGSHRFVNWTQKREGGQHVASYTFNMLSANVTLTAHFK